MMKAAALACSVAFAFALAALAVQTCRLDVEQAEHKLTQKDLADARRQTAEWKAAEEYRRIREAGQAALGQACLAREQAAEADADLWNALTRANPPVAITPQQEKQVVSHEVRSALIDAFAQPLD